MSEQYEPARWAHTPVEGESPPEGVDLWPTGVRSHQARGTAPMSSTKSSRKVAVHRGGGPSDLAWRKRFEITTRSDGRLAAIAVPGAGVGTFVVPGNPRHPLIVANMVRQRGSIPWKLQPRLGIGAHAPRNSIRDVVGPIRGPRLRENLEVLSSIFDTGASRPITGRSSRARRPMSRALPGGTPCPCDVRPGGQGITGGPGSGRNRHPAVTWRVRANRGTSSCPHRRGGGSGGARPAPQVIARHGVICLQKGRCVGDAKVCGA